ncbi:DUF5704 domain-containing protein [Paenibacillus campinasensis]|uniref:DUF5704 domain-containing protein n=1 Tax=Paenibacillus campinasensis TaxID=66347 RepID=UPI0015CAC9D0|nr:DUF5704 domain-containing protein [Paenibacillus campinasensis]
MNNIGTDNDAYPAIGEVRDKIEMKSNPLYQPHGYVDYSGLPVPKSSLTNERIVRVETVPGRQGKESNITNLEITDLKTAILITSQTGKVGPSSSDLYHEFTYEDTGERPWNDACSCFLPWTVKKFGFYTPLNLFWRADEVEQKKIEVQGKTSLKVGEETSLQALVSTIAPGETDYKNPINVATRAETKWSSDKSAVVSLVNDNGRVKANSPGSAKITAVWRSDGDNGYILTASITITVDGAPTPDPDPPEASCTPPTPGRQINGRYMDPVVTAKILADQRGSEQFDVLQGIPTSETLYGNIFARSYLAQHTFVEMSGVCTFQVNVEKTWTLHWDPGKPGPDDDDGNPTTVPDPQSATEVVTERYTVERPYSYWVIDNLEVYQIDNGKLRNYALPGGEITIHPQGYQPPQFTASSTGNYYPPSPPDPIVAPSGSYGGSGFTSRPSPPSENLQSVAEQGVEKVQVTNDTLVFNGQTLMSGSRVAETGPTPSPIPEPPQIDENVLYRPGNLITPDKVNRANTTSAGNISYKLLPGNINGGNDKEFPIYGINTVTVHTPVVNYSSVTDDRAHNQKTKPNYNRAAFILDRPFIVRIPTSGQHANYPGYGNRDYAKYFRTKQVRFPFDVYSGDRRTFYPKNTWIDIPVNQLDTEFFLPVWVDEGDYQVYFRNIAENSPPDLPYQYDANLDLVNHVAADEVSVEVIGRLYDFRITDVADYNWEQVFRTQKGSATPTGISYWVGLNGIDGAARGNTEPFTLPIRPGSHPVEGYKNVAVKTGYHVKFDLKTKGNMFGKQDGIRITPTFHFVSKDGQYRFPVDLYYKTNDRNFVKIGSQEDKVDRFVIMNDVFRNVPTEELVDTASIKYDNYFTPGQLGPMTRQEYIQTYINKETKKKTPVGGYDLLLLPEQLRSFIGPKTNIPASVNVQRANAAVQKWYGEYSLPAEPYVVEAGLDIAEYGRTHGGLDDNSPIFFKNGYIIVNFNIETIRNADLQNPHLQYIHAPLMNQWQLEGYQRIVRDSFGNRFTLQDGDVVFYHADLSSRDDFSSQVPH